MSENLTTPLHDPEGHHAITDEMASQPEDTACFLLKTPREIRRMIYSYVCDSSHPFLRLNHTPLNPTPATVPLSGSSHPHALLLVNKEIADKYAAHLFKLALVYYDFFTHLILTGSVTGWKPSSLGHFQYASRVTINVKFDNIQWASIRDITDDILKALTHFLRDLHSLSHLNFHIYLNVPSTDGRPLPGRFWDYLEHDSIYFEGEYRWGRFMCAMDMVIFQALAKMGGLNRSTMKHSCGQLQDHYFASTKAVLEPLSDGNWSANYFTLSRRSLTWGEQPKEVTVLDGKHLEQLEWHVNQRLYGNQAKALQSLPSPRVLPTLPDSDVAYCKLEINDLEAILKGRGLRHFGTKESLVRWLVEDDMACANARKE
ncbi:hypothetical protein EJ08DRAFT_691403 [Tothia fuscella]|uniref:SAP domain-containing protein n=1 Tax=Tothia fuscella TaxID=1048955 RepID=A0A9P4P454_9PEZI|nr:hypothetical protein EJ08DRAFT_691403 [Tothia fuscella]